MKKIALLLAVTLVAVLFTGCIPSKLEGMEFTGEGELGYDGSWYPLHAEEPAFEITGTQQTRDGKTETLSLEMRTETLAGGHTVDRAALVGESILYPYLDVALLMEATEDRVQIYLHESVLENPMVLETAEAIEAMLTHDFVGEHCRLEFTPYGIQCFSPDGTAYAGDGTWFLLDGKTVVLNFLELGVEEWRLPMKEGTILDGETIQSEKLEGDFRITAK